MVRLHSASHQTKEVKVEWTFNGLGRAEVKAQATGRVSERPEVYTYMPDGQGGQQPFVKMQAEGMVSRFVVS